MSTLLPFHNPPPPAFSFLLRPDTVIKNAQKQAGSHPMDAGIQIHFAQGFLDRCRYSCVRWGIPNESPQS